MIDSQGRSGRRDKLLVRESLAGRWPFLVVCGRRVVAGDFGGNEGENDVYHADKQEHDGNDHLESKGFREHRDSDKDEKQAFAEYVAQKAEHLEGGLDVELAQ